MCTPRFFQCKEAMAFTILYDINIIYINNAITISNIKVSPAPPGKQDSRELAKQLASSGKQAAEIHRLRNTFSPGTPMPASTPRLLGDPPGPQYAPARSSTRMHGRLFGPHRSNLPSIPAKASTSRFARSSAASICNCRFSARAAATAPASHHSTPLLISQTNSARHRPRGRHTLQPAQQRRRRRL